MKTKLLITPLLCFLSLSVFAENAPSLILKTEGNVTSAQEKLITGALNYINQIWGKPASRSLTQTYFTPNATLVVNGKQVYAGYGELESHFQDVGKSIHGAIRFPLREVMRIDNKLIVRFDEDIYDNKGVYYPTMVIAIFTLDKNRIQQWDEVVDSNYFCQPEAASVVYPKK